MESVNQRRRTDAAKAAVVDEGVSMAKTSGVLTAFMHLMEKGISPDTIRRILRGEHLRGGPVYKIG